MLHDIHFLTILIATISAFALGGAWYSPYVFGTIWQREAKVPCTDHQHTNAVYLLAFLCALIAAVLFYFVVGPHANLVYSIKLALAIGLGWVATSYGVNYAFANRGIKLFLIDAGYHVFQFIAYALVFSYWP